MRTKATPAAVVRKSWVRSTVLPGATRRVAVPMLKMWVEVGLGRGEILRIWAPFFSYQSGTMGSVIIV